MRVRIGDATNRDPPGRSGWLGRGIALVLGLAAGTLLFPRPARGRPGTRDTRA